MKGWELREHRRAQRLTLWQVARASGTSPSNVAAYERCVKQPREKTLQRLVAVIDAGGDSPIHRRQLLTVPATGAALRKGLRSGWTTADLLRLVRQMRADASGVSSSGDRLAFFAEPSTTGDPRWDAMLAGNVENLALRDGNPVPEWSRGHALAEFWFVGSSPRLRAYAFARSPISLQVRGVMVDPADLESV